MVTIEGRWAVEAALRSPFFCVRSVLVEEGRHAELVDLAEHEKVPLRKLPSELMAQEAGFDFHRGALARADRPESPSFEDEVDSIKRLVVPVGLADGGNLGTIIRTAAAFGADGVLIESGKGADIYSRKCIRASATAIFRLPVFEVSSVPMALAKFREFNGMVLGASLSDRAAELPKKEMASKCAVLLGAEKDGLTRDLELSCDELIRLPMSHDMDSLNVAATASIVLYELFGRVSRSTPSAPDQR
jgi:tRNA G18 (ribose-2'-O)-methylase SpoU